jgi:DNA-binding transcriptional MerR regulator
MQNNINSCGPADVNNLTTKPFDVQLLNRYNWDINGSKTGHAMEKLNGDKKEAVQKIIGEPKEGPFYRSGSAARLAGLSAETLRVWERRYGVSNTERSEHGQRLYSTAQVERLRLLKHLVDQGHPIGLIAGLPVEQLQELNGAVASGQTNVSGPIRVGVIGQRLKERIAVSGRDSLSLDIRCSSATLEQALPTMANAGLEVLVVELPELDESAVPLIVQAKQSTNALAVLVLYRFCASATIRQLRENGCVVARVPADMAELVLLCRTALAGQRAALPGEHNAPYENGKGEPAPPKFDDKALTTLVTASNKIGCECPKHLAEILMMVGSFERYSAQCASRNPDDEQLHKELEHAAGQARSILEMAMERLARAEGLKH